MSEIDDILAQAEVGAKIIAKNPTSKKKKKKKKNLADSDVPDTDVPLDSQEKELFRRLMTCSEDQIAKISKAESSKASKIFSKVREQINPYTMGFEPRDEYLTCCYTTPREEHLEREIISSFIAYLFTACQEWMVPDGVPAISPEDYYRNHHTMDLPEMADGTTADPNIRIKYEESKELMEMRMVVWKFLVSQFKFDPGQHVRSAYDANPEDPGRKPVASLAASYAVHHRRMAVANRKKVDLKHLQKLDTIRDYVEGTFWAYEHELLIENYTEEVNRCTKQIAQYTMKLRVTESADNKFITINTRSGKKEKVAAPWKDGEKERFIQKYILMLNDLRCRKLEYQEKIYNILKKSDPPKAAEFLDSLPRLLKFLGEKKEIYEEELKAYAIERDLREQKKQQYQEEFDKSLEEKRQREEEENKQQDAKVNKVTATKAGLGTEDKPIILNNKQKPTEEKKRDEPTQDIKSDEPTPPTPPTEDIKSDEPTDSKQMVESKSLIIGKVPPPESHEERWQYICEILSRGEIDPRRILRQMIPPEDLFIKFARYRKKFHEEIIGMVKDLYSSQRNIDFCILPLGFHKNIERAQQFIQEHRDRIVLEAHTIKLRAWTMLGEYKENQESIRYYRDNGSVIEQMMDHHRESAKMHRHLVRKQRDRKKKEHQKGEDPQIVKDWMKKKKQESGMTDEFSDTDDAIDITHAEVNEEVPLDEIEVPTWMPSSDGKSIKMDRFFVPAKAPSNQM
jgi:hypothetical protein